MSELAEALTKLSQERDDLKFANNARHVENTNLLANTHALSAQVQRLRHGIDLALSTLDRDDIAPEHKPCAAAHILRAALGEG